MESKKKLRLGHVEGEDAACLRETMNVEGISVEDMTRRVVKSYLSQKTAQDKERRTFDIVEFEADEGFTFEDRDGRRVTVTRAWLKECITEACEKALREHYKGR